MTVVTSVTAKSYFNTGDKPTESQFGDIMDTIYHGMIDVVRDHVAKGDGIIATDGAISTGTPNFTSAGAAFVSADVNKLFSVTGAGASATVLSTTILTVVSATAVTLATNAGTTVSSATYSYGTDDTTALQAAADKQKPVWFPVGQYHVTGEIVFKNGTKFIGSGWWGGFAGNPDPTLDTIIFYNGAGGSNSAVIRASQAAVGTDPTDNAAGSQNLRAIGMESISIDGNGLAEYGIYMARAGIGCHWERISVQNTKEHGIWAGLHFVSVFKDVVCSDNEKNGFTLGRNDFSWTKNTLNDCVFINCRAVDNGTGKTFDDATNLREGSGWDVEPFRGNIWIGCNADENNGPGILWSPDEGPNTWIGGHCELNCQLTVGEGRSTRVWGIYVLGQNASLNNRMDSIFLNSDQFIKLAGTEPSTTRFEAAFRFINFRIGAGIDADWDNYSLEDCGLEMFSNIIGTAPQNAVKRLNTGVLISALMATATLDFADTATQTHTDLTITVTGATTLDVVSVRAPDAAILAGTHYSAWVSAADTVTVRFNNYSVASRNPGSNPFKVIVWRSPSVDVTE